MPGQRIIALANHKGGTAKTTTAVNLATSLAEHDRRVLLVDLDPQGSASTWLGVESDRGIHAVLTDGQTLDSQVIATAVERVFVIPASRRLAVAERIMAGELGAETVLRRKMAQGGPRAWDYILLDTPPALGLLTINALAAAQEVLVPVEAHVLALAGVAQMIDTIGLIQERFNPSLALTGFVICRFDSRTRHGVEVMESLATRFPEKVLKAVIRENVRLAEAPSFGAPVATYAPRSTGAADYRELAAEILGMEQA